MGTGLCLFLYTIFVGTWTIIPILVWAIPLPIMHTFVTVLIAGTKVWPRTPTTGVYKEYNHSIRRNQDFGQIWVGQSNRTRKLLCSAGAKSDLNGIFHKMSSHILTDSSKWNIPMIDQLINLPSVCPSVCLSVCLSVFLPIISPLCPPSFLRIRLSVCTFCLVQSVSLSVCLSICLSVSLNLCLPFQNLDLAEWS